MPEHLLFLNALPRGRVARFWHQEAPLLPSTYSYADHLQQILVCLYLRSKDSSRRGFPMHKSRCTAQADSMTQHSTESHCDTKPHHDMLRVVSAHISTLGRSLARPIAMSQLRKRKSIASGELEAVTQEPPTPGTQGPATPAQDEPVPASIRRSRRAAVSAVLRRAEFADDPASSQLDIAVAPDIAPAANAAKQRRKKTAGVAANDAAVDLQQGPLEAAPSVVVAAPIRRGRRKAEAAATDAALSVEADPSAGPELAIPVKRVRRKKTAVTAADVPVLIQDIPTAQSDQEAAPAKKPRAARRRKAAADVAPAPADAVAVVDAPPLPALTVERMPAAISHLSAADPGAAVRLRCGAFNIMIRA